MTESSQPPTPEPEDSLFYTEIDQDAYAQSCREFMAELRQRLLPDVPLEAFDD